MKYFDIFDSLGAELDEKKSLKAPRTLVEREKNAPEVESIIDQSKLKIFNGLKVFYNELQLILFEWSLKKDAFEGKLEVLGQEDYISGSINVVRFKAHLSGPEGKGWTPSIWNSEMDAETLEEHKKFRPFDFPDSRIAAGFMVEDGEIKDEVYLYYLSDRVSEIFDMEMNLEEYLRLLHKTRGFAGWQVAWLFRNGYEYDFMMHYFPQIFPDVDISEFKPRD